MTVINNKIKYIIKTDQDPDMFQKLIDRVNSGEFNDAEVDDAGRISGLRENGRRIPNTIIFKDLQITKFTDDEEFDTIHSGDIVTHRTCAWKHFYIQMEDGLTFYDYGSDVDFFKTNKADIWKYCVQNISPDWADTDYIELDDIVL